MRRGLILAAVLALGLGAVVSAQSDAPAPADVAHYAVRSGDTSAMAIARRLCGPDAPPMLGAQILAMNRDLFAVLNVGEILHVPADCPEVTPSTTSPASSSSSPSTTLSIPTTPPSSSSVVPSTTSVAPSTTTSTTMQPATTTTTVPEPPSGFLASFDTADDFYDRFQLDVHFRDDVHVDWGRVFPGDHDMACGSPTTQRDVHLHPEVDGANKNLDASELFWHCAPGGDAAKGHIMTGMADVDGYTILSFAPDRSFTNVRRVCWDVNSTDLGGRKWTQALVIPEAAYRANGGRLDYISPVTQDVDTTALSLPAGTFAFQNWDHKFRLYQGTNEILFDWAQFSVTDKAKRYRHCMTDNGDGTVTVEQERELRAMGTDPDGYRRVTVDGSFPDQARVVFQDDNYTPEKDGPIAGYSWHWDNVRVEVG